MFSICSCLGLLSLLCLILLFVVIIVLKMVSDKHPKIVIMPQEKWYWKDHRAEKAKFASLDDEASVDLSVIIPAYNETQRLPIMVNEMMEHFADRKRRNSAFTYEVIVVDDGSSDKTSEVALQYTDKYGSDVFRVLTLAFNRGKGGAVRLGMLSARGRYLLFADADGATKFSDIEKCEAACNKLTGADSTKSAIVCGSRAHLEQDSIAHRSLFRTILMKGFHFLVYFLCVQTVKDTQCGFKLFSRISARQLFKRLHVERWAFDVELLYIAQQLAIPIAEVCVTWHEVDGSKVTPFWSWLQMGRDLVLIRLRYMCGAWSL